MEQIQAWEQQLMARGKDFHSVMVTLHLMESVHWPTQYTVRNRDILYEVFTALDERRSDSTPEKRIAAAEEAIRLWKSPVPTEPVDEMSGWFEEAGMAFGTKLKKFTSLRDRMIFQPRPINSIDDETVYVHFCDWRKKCSEGNAQFLNDIADELGIPVEALEERAVHLDGMQHAVRNDATTCLGSCSRGPAVAITLHDSTIEEDTISSLNDLKQRIASHAKKTKPGGT